MDSSKIGPYPSFLKSVLAIGTAVSNFSAMAHGFPSMIIHEIMATMPRSWNDSRHGASMNHGWKSMNDQSGWKRNTTCYPHV